MAKHAKDSDDAPSPCPCAAEKSAEPKKRESASRIALVTAVVTLLGAALTLFGILIKARESPSIDVAPSARPMPHLPTTLVHTELTPGRENQPKSTHFAAPPPTPTTTPAPEQTTEPEEPPTTTTTTSASTPPETPTTTEPPTPSDPPLTTPPPGEPMAFTAQPF